MENIAVKELKEYFERKINEVVLEQKSMFMKHEENVTKIISSNLKIINQRFEQLTEEIRGNKEDLKIVKSEVNDLKTSIQFTENLLEDKIRSINDKISTIEKDRAAIIEKLRTLEDRNRRNNLRIEGISENKYETWEDTTEKVQRLFSHRLGLDNIEIERAHRTGIRRSNKPRSITLKLLRYQDKERIMKERRKLKGSEIYINEDFSKETVEIRKKLREKIKERQTKDGEILIIRYDKIVSIKKRNQDRQNDST